MNCIGATLTAISFAVVVWSRHATHSLPRGVARPNNGCDRHLVSLRVWASWIFILALLHERFNSTVDSKPKLHFISLNKDISQSTFFQINENTLNEEKIIIFQRLSRRRFNGMGFGGGRGGASDFSGKSGAMSQFFNNRGYPASVVQVGHHSA